MEKMNTIIVGAGSGGAVLAARLSENSNRKVMLLEAGYDYGPKEYPESIANSNIVGTADYNWGYKTEPGYVKHEISAIRGKVVGGSSAVNGGVALRARKEDFDRWNLKGWSYEELLPVFKKLESNPDGDEAIHGRTGPFPIHQFTKDEVTPLQNKFIEASVANGLKEIKDFDGPDANGVGPYPMNIINGQRINTGMAYLTNEVRKRKNLTIQAGCLVDKIIFEDKRAVGVQFVDGNAVYADEVILSAGTYGSAAILLRSGIGPAAHSKRLGIPVVSDLPVGVNIYDHPFYYNAYAIKPEFAGAQTPVIGAKVWTRSYLAAPGELDLHITATHLFPHEYSPTKVGFVFAVALTRPESKGSIWLESLDPSAAPKIDLNFLSTESDRKRILEGVKLARKIGQTAPFHDLTFSELAPGSEITDDAAIMEQILGTLDSYHHPASSAPMGERNDPKAVVDMEGKVYGVEGLRVVDASIFPDVPSVATNVTTIAAAEYIAEMINK
jgi:choline dehydrogenase